MADSKPPQDANIDLVDSYARLRGTQVEIVLRAPRFEGSNDAALVLRRGKRRVLAPVSVIDDESRTVFAATVPRERLGNGIWSLRLRSGEDGLRVSARLLVQGDRPIVLLWGTDSQESALPVPHPRDNQPAGARAKAKLVASRMLSLLPDESAATVRRNARRLLRRG